MNHASCDVYESCCVTHMNISRDSHMRWLRLVGSLNLQVSFAKEPYKRDYILQKRPTILRSLLIVATPYEWDMSPRATTLGKITLQHTATHCNTRHHTAPHCNTLQHTATHRNTLQHSAAHCNTLLPQVANSLGIVTRMNTSCHTYEWITSHAWMSHGTHINVSFHKYLPKLRVEQPIKISHGTHMNGSCQTHQHVSTSPITYTIWNCGKGSPWIQMRHGTHMNGSCHTHHRVSTSHFAYYNSKLRVGQPVKTNTSCHTYERVMSHI